jgi:hypothetical protein
VAVVVQTGTSQRSGIVAAAADVWAAEELRRADRFFETLLGAALSRMPGRMYADAELTRHLGPLYSQRLLCTGSASPPSGL